MGFEPDEYYVSTPSIAKRVAAEKAKNPHLFTGTHPAFGNMHKTMEKTHESAEMLGRGKPYDWKPED